MAGCSSDEGVAERECARFSTTQARGDMRGELHGPYATAVGHYRRVDAQQASYASDMHRDQRVGEVIARVNQPG